MSARDEFPRTSCACSECRVGCKTMPGTLAVGDLERIAEYRGATDVYAFAAEHFEASDGAVIGKIDKATGEQRVFRVPSIVPARKENGECVFLGADGSCGIHPVSPMGCSHFDTHIPRAEADRRSLAMYREIASDRAYWDVRERLEEQGKVAAPSKVRREAFENELLKVRADNSPRKIGDYVWSDKEQALVAPDKLRKIEYAGSTFRLFGWEWQWIYLGDYSLQQIARMDATFVESLLWQWRQDRI